MTERSENVVLTTDSNHVPVDDSVCGWQRSEDGQDDTDCGGTWELNDGTPAQHGMKFCPYCGRPLQWHDVEPEEPGDPDGECYRGGEYADSVAHEMAEARKLK
jgi:hypothetical protein